MNLGIGDYLVASTDDLVQRGVPRRDVAWERQAMTGHRRPLSEKWIRAVGAWGGVLSLEEIARRVGVEPAVVRDYAKGMGLRAATRNRRRTQPELAVLLWCDRQRPPLESCGALGVLPVERVLYCAALQWLLDDAGVGIDAALGWSIAELRARWSEHDLDIENYING